MSQNEPSLLRLVMMSDLHLTPEGATRCGLDMGDRFAAAIADVNRLHHDADLCVFAGDLSDNKGNSASYERFEKMRPQIHLPQRVMIGNHDIRSVYLEHAVDPMLDENGFVQGIVDLKGHRIIMLDTNDEVFNGFLCELRLMWLAKRLEEAKGLGLKVILILHHNPHMLQMPVDLYRLEKPERLLAVLREAGAEVLQILCGHVHITTAGSWAGYPIASISGNMHRVEAYLRGRTDGQQTSYEGPAQYGVLLSDGLNCAFHFHNYIDRNIALADTLFPWKKEQSFAPIWTEEE